MYKALEVEFIISKQCYLLLTINSDNKMNMKHVNVRVIRITLDLHGAIVDSRKVVLFEYKINFFL